MTIQRPETDGSKNRCASCMLCIWNPKTKQFFGRTASSWVKIVLFYLIFYACLAAFWSCLMKIFMTTINYQSPKYIMHDSLIGTSPGLAFRPRPKDETNLINFTPEKNETYSHWIEDLEKFLKKYRKALKDEAYCETFPERNCTFMVDLNENPCGSNFGYDTTSPCVLIKLNRIYGWYSKPYKTVEEMEEIIDRNSELSNIDLNVIETELTSGEGQILLHCEETNNSENLVSIEYWPRQGFPTEYFPYLHQSNYLSPFVLAKFNVSSNLARGTQIKIDCFAIDQNIEINRQDHEGTISFRLRIDN